MSNNTVKMKVSPWEQQIITHFRETGCLAVKAPPVVLDDDLRQFIDELITLAYLTGVRDTELGQRSARLEQVFNMAGISHI